MTIIIRAYWFDIIIKGNLIRTATFGAVLLRGGRSKLDERQSGTCKMARNLSNLLRRFLSGALYLHCLWRERSAEMPFSANCPHVLISKELFARRWPSGHYGMDNESHAEHSRNADTLRFTNYYIVDNYRLALNFNWSIFSALLNCSASWDSSRSSHPINKFLTNENNVLHQSDGKP